jgi:hypothetical protein
MWLNRHHCLFHSWKWLGNCLKNAIQVKRQDAFIECLHNPRNQLHTLAVNASQSEDVAKDAFVLSLLCSSSVQC